MYLYGICVFILLAVILILLILPLSVGLFVIFTILTVISFVSCILSFNIHREKINIEKKYNAYDKVDRMSTLNRLLVSFILFISILVVNVIIYKSI